MRKVLALFLIGFCTVGVFAQKTGLASKSNKKATDLVLTPKRELENAISKSMKAEKFRIKVQGNVLNNEIFSTFEYLSPDRYRFVDTISGKSVKEAIEIAKQRYQKKNDEWVKTRLHYAPLRNQLIAVFPVKLNSKPGDAILVKNVKVNLLGEEYIDEKKYRKFGYSVSYSGWDVVDNGVAWVNKSSGLLERLETKTDGLLGQTTGVFNYFYDKEIIIDPPKDFIERDWID